MNPSISFIGCGNMGSALMKGMKKDIPVKNIFLSDEDKAKAAALAEETGAVCANDNREAAMKGDFIFLAVKPDQMKNVLEEIAPVIEQRNKNSDFPIVVSMAAGWTISAIDLCLGASLQKIVRIMPNTPALISKGVIALAASSSVPQNKTAELIKLLSFSGIVEQIDEKFMNAVTGLSGSGPAFVYLFIEALADGGVRAGLPRDKALAFAAQTVLGSAAMVLETGKHPAVLKDMVCSPGGTTIAGVKALENGSFRGTVINAVEAAYRRAVEMSS